MEFYDEFVDRLPDILKVKNAAVTKAKVEQLLRAFNRKFWGEYDAATLTMLYMKFLTKFLNSYFRGSYHVLEIYVLKIEGKYLT